MPETKKTRKRPGRQPGTTLTREAILDRALELVERDGVAALSMRRLGEELGVDATAFYRHFRDKDALVLAAYDRVTDELADLVRELDPSLPWRTRLERLAEAGWALSERYPAMYSLGWARITGGPAEREIVEFILGTLASTGLAADRAVLYYRTFADLTLSLSGMRATVAALDPALREKDANAWTNIYAALPQSEYPAAIAHAAELQRVTETEIYELAIQALLDRVEREIG
ncbi:TetR/AcrR family transcriptional regulator [Nocardioides mangrovi]|uniref:TetR/AcrR family transcriptional regulator n=1 Tax=Nocardioides mangrovi TaxID=2874580 RepID=A0ABS7U8W6_9ACTN|nr:TetR/AcrR family transcriptional regulator [Nocardioides mangrovi]MBZ5737097.1 TetR/AcrR family transcriptional regulator [Nocardioides mangrovi]